MIRILTVEAVEDDVFVGPAPIHGKGRAFGGRLIGQGLAAAIRRAAPAKAPHSLHAYFMRPAAETDPILYRTRLERDGRSFALLHVTGEQGATAVLDMSVSFHAREAGLSHQFDPPVVPPPEALLSEADYWRDRADQLPPGAYDRMTRPRSMEFRPVQHRALAPQEPRAPAMQVWLRCAAPVPDDPGLNRAMLAYASDMLLLGAAHLPHAISWMTHPMTMASLDHALWLHEDVRMDDWVLFSMESPWTGGGRGFTRGLFHDRRGRLVASVAQEGLIRLHNPRSS